MLDLFAENAPFPKGSADYRAGLAAYKSRLEQSDRNLELMLSAAAYREELVGESGEVLEIDAEMIGNVLGGLDAAFRRMQRLLDPKWSEQ